MIVMGLRWIRTREKKKARDTKRKRNRETHTKRAREKKTFACTTNYLFCTKIRIPMGIEQQQNYSLYKQTLKWFGCYTKDYDFNRMWWASVSTDHTVKPLLALSEYEENHLIYRKSLPMHWIVTKSQSLNAMKGEYKFIVVFHFVIAFSKHFSSFYIRESLAIFDSKLFICLL